LKFLIKNNPELVLNLILDSLKQ